MTLTTKGAILRTTLPTHQTSGRGQELISYKKGERTSKKLRILRRKRLPKADHHEFAGSRVHEEKKPRREFFKRHITLNYRFLRENRDNTP